MENTMKASTQKVLGILKRDGHITRVVAAHYNIGCVRKAVSDLRKARFDIVTDKRIDSEGNKYTRWVLVSREPMASKAMKRGDQYRVVGYAHLHFYDLGEVITLESDTPTSNGYYDFTNGIRHQYLKLQDVVKV